MYNFLILFMALIVISCSSGKPSAPVSTPSPVTAAKAVSLYAVEIQPRVAVRGTQLGVIVSGFALSEAKFEWLVNGSILNAPIPGKFDATQTRKGDTVQLKASLHGTEVLSQRVTIGNAPPVITSAKLVPDFNKFHTAFKAEAEATDVDEDSVTLSYIWTKNGQTAGEGASLEIPVKRGDKISVTITPFDGTDYGNPVMCAMVMQNLSPVIIENKEFTFDGAIYTYQVKAVDPDGDTLTYSLESSPDGMAIDSKTGLVTWAVPAEFRGTREAVINVSDGNGGNAKNTITMTIK